MKRELLLIFGLACIWVRLLSTGFCSPMVFVNESYHLTAIVTIANGSSLLTLAIAFFALRKTGELSAHPKLLLSLGAMSSIGLALVFFGVSHPSFFSLGVIGALMEGIGGSFAPLQWREASSDWTSREGQRTSFLVSTCVAAIVFLISVSLPPLPMMLINASMPFFSSLSLVQAYEKQKIEEKEAAFALLKKRAKGRIELPYPLFAFCIVFAMLASPQRTNLLPIRDLSLTSWSIISASTVLLTLLAVAILHVLDKRKIEKIDLLFPLFVIMCNAAPYIAPSNPIVANVFVFAGMLLYWSMVYSEIGSSISPSFSPAQLMAAGIICLRLGTFGGIYLGMALETIESKWMIGFTLAFVILLAWIFRLLRAQDVPERFLGAFQPENNTRKTLSASIEQQIRAKCEILSSKYELSTREEDILRALARGMSAKNIAEAMVISENTVKTHIAHIYKKMDVHSRSDLQKIIENCSEDAS